MDKPSTVEESVDHFLKLLESSGPLDLKGFLDQIPHSIRDETEAACAIAMGVCRLPSGVRETPLVPGYEDLILLGEGGMGTVYRAWDPSLSRSVALKFIRADRVASGDFKSRFDVEARALAGLDHPGIVRLYGRGDSGGHHYLVMEFVQGRSLRALLNQSRNCHESEPEGPTALPLLSGRHHFQRAARIISEAASAIAHAHERGVFHRDLKPENIQMGAAGHTRIIDFGLAGTLTSDSIVDREFLLGTAMYTPPRRHASGSPAERDIWAMGVILYELATLKPPFGGTTLQELETAAERGDFIRPSVHAPDLPKDLELIITKALHPHPADRYGSAVELEQDLVRFLGGAPVSAGRRSPLARSVRHVRRHWRAYAAGAGVVLAAVIAFLLSARWHREKEEESLFAQIEAVTPSGSADFDAIPAIIRRRAQLRAISEREDLSQQAQEKLEVLMRDLTVQAQEVMLGLRKSTRKAMGSGKLTSINSYRPLSEAALFPILGHAQQLKTQFGALIEGDPLGEVLPQLSIMGDFPRSSEAVVEIRALNLLTGTTEDLLQILHLPLDRVAIPSGFIMIRIKIPNYGHAEYIRYPQFGEHLVLVPRILPDAEVVNAFAMCEIPAGEYTVGQASDDPTLIYSRRRFATLGFYMDKYETTCAEYREFLLAHPNEPRPRGWGDQLENYDSAFNQLPVCQVSWMSAQRYAEWRGKRLPTWQEWHVAIRGPHSYLAPWGNEPGDALSQTATSRPLSAGPAPVGTHPVDTSPFGVMDGFGNVREWTALPFLSVVEGRVYPAAGSRLTVGYSWKNRNLADPWFGIEGVSEGKVPMADIGIRCVKSLVDER